ncbi:hypothetical protein DRE_03900 [Drechslerella stenobrocha 248]|uniref:BZIP domain-containing protein n=1 Tax=Drechslerella stenobrocha 248 TaxID=1043628 RepID=W7I3U3_9PEZI|nr:hypothetical protein DRE_03900 [Drechslerella stenobrocha 248]
MSAKSPELFLSPDQRALLLAALNSNSQPRSDLAAMKESSTSESLDSPQKGDSSFDTSLFTDADALADVDYNFDLSDYHLGDIGLEGGEHEKRKLSIDDESNDEADPHAAEPKRREGDDKTAKKPGRKPIINEPTSKRKAQNRAAQRAFRERKEKHLKDLEQKVQDLEKKSENTNQENKVLKDQVDKLQSELKEYRKRFSLGGGNGSNRSPSNSVSNNLDNLGSTGGFSFDFPLFGSFSAPGSNVPNRVPQTASPPRASASPLNYRVSPAGLLEIDRMNRSGVDISSSSPHNSNNNSPAVKSNANGFSNGNSQSPLQVHRVSVDEPQFNPASNDILSELFSPSILRAANSDLNGDYLDKGASLSSSQSTPHMSSLFSFSDSPSASSVSQNSIKNGQNSSSCGTTPEAMDAASPPLHNKVDSSSRLNSISEEGITQPQESTISTTATDNSFAWFASHSGGLEPSIFNNYRDPATAAQHQPQQAVNSVGMSYFDDAFPSTFDFTLPPTPPANSVDKSTAPAPAPGINGEDDDEEVVPADKPGAFLKCTQIWDKVQQHPKFVSGEIDMDDLCTELRAKAKCSEGGVVVDKTDVEKILNKPVPSMWGL